LNHLLCIVVVAATLTYSDTAIASSSIYLCQRSGAPSTFATKNELRVWRNKGYRCQIYMEGSKPSAPSSKPVPRSWAPPPKSSKKASSGKKARRAGRSITPPRASATSKDTKTRYALYAPYVAEASEKYRIPVALIRAVMRVESAFHYQAVSSAGAQGLMQLMPKTARSMGVNDSFDPRQNIMGGTKLLRVLANRFDGDFVKVLSAYHAGAGAVNKKGGIPFEATEGYVRSVLNHYYTYQDSDDS
jgi:soluble lytic murein transglycosylase-like protein